MAVIRLVAGLCEVEGEPSCTAFCRRSGVGGIARHFGVVSVHVRLRRWLYTGHTPRELSAAHLTEAGSLLLRGKHSQREVALKIRVP